MKFLLALILSAVFLLSSTVSLACDRLISTKSKAQNKGQSSRVKKQAKNSKVRKGKDSKKVARHKKKAAKKTQIARHKKIKQLPPKFVQSKPVKDDELSLDTMLATSIREPSSEAEAIPLPEIPAAETSPEEIQMDF